MTTLEKIRAEIAQLQDEWFKETDGWWCYEKSLQIIDKYAEQEQTGKCRTCKYGEIYNDLWCKCHDPLLDGIMVKMTEKCRAEEIIELNRKFKAERGDKE